MSIAMLICAHAPGRGAMTANLWPEMRVLLSDDSSGGGADSPAVNVQNPVEVSHAPPPVVAPGTPPAAETVIKAEVTEDTLLLKARLDETERKLKAREMEHASVADEFKRYKDATEARAVPIKREKIDSKTKPFRLGRFV